MMHPRAQARASTRRDAPRPVLDAGVFDRVGTLLSTSSDNGMAIEEISRLVGHSSTNVTETVYRHQLRPVITTGAEVMDKLFSGSEP